MRYDNTNTNTKQLINSWETGIISPWESQNKLGKYYTLVNRQEPVNVPVTHGDWENSPP